MTRRVVGRMGSLALGAGIVAAVHGAVLKSSMGSVEAGQVLPLTGVDFHAGMTVSLVLVGVFEEHALGEATANDGGDLTKEVLIPAHARPGDYQVVAYEPGGARAAALDITVLAAGPASAAGQSHEVEHAEAEPSAARAEEMMIERSMRGSAWGVIGLMIGLAGGLGTVLVRGTPATES